MATVVELEKKVETLQKTLERMQNIISEQEKKISKTINTQAGIIKIKDEIEKDKKKLNASVDAVRTNITSMQDKLNNVDESGGGAGEVDAKEVKKIILATSPTHENIEVLMQKILKKKEAREKNPKVGPKKKKSSILMKMLVLIAFLALSYAAYQQFDTYKTREVKIYDKKKAKYTNLSNGRKYILRSKNGKGYVKLTGRVVYKETKQGRKKYFVANKRVKGKNEKWEFYLGDG